MANVYKFIQSEDGQYILTDVSTEINLYGIYRILGTVKVKGKKSVYEKIEIRNRYFNDDGIYLTERKNISQAILSHFIRTTTYGDRSKQWQPYERDLLDRTLLEDLGITVMTYKHYYRSNPIGRKLVDLYYPVKTCDVCDELKNELLKRTESAIKESENVENAEKFERKESAKWNKV